MKFVSLTIGAMSVIMLSGCIASKPPVALNNKFDTALTKSLFESRGKNTIQGNAFLRQQGGGVVTCAGSDVRMLPVTQYSTERIQHIYSNSERGYRPFFMGPVQFTENPYEYQQYHVTNVCDSQGNFSFDNVGDGDYYVTTMVKWQVGYNMQGGLLMQKVKVSNGENKKLVLTQ